MAQAAQAQGRQAPQPSTFDQIVNYARRAKGAYDDANNLYNAGASVANYFFPTYTPATQVAWNQAAGEAGQALWNAGADAATSQAGGSLGAQTGGAQAGGTLAKAAPWIAAAFSAYKSGKSLFNKNLRDEEKAYEAALAAPRAVAAFYTLGLSSLAEGFARGRWKGTMKKVDKFMANNPMSPTFLPMQLSRLWTSDKWKTEGKRLRQLERDGVIIPDSLRLPMNLTRGRRPKDLINPYLPSDFVGSTPQYGWTNNKFASSRNEADLRPEDIWGYSAFFTKYGNDWLGKFSEQDRRAIAQQALNRGLVNEHHGTIDINWTPELEADANALIGRKVTPRPLTANPQPSTRAPAFLPPTVKDDQIPAANRKNQKGILNKIISA